MRFSIKHLGTTILLTSLLAGPVVLPAEAHEGKADPNGIWTWTRQGRNGEESTRTLKLKVAGEKLTGKISGRNNSETEISNGKVNGDKISFDVVRSFNGNSFTLKYAAKIEGDSLKGEWIFSRDGQERSREWTAKRAVAGLDGDWLSAITRSNGETMDLTLSFKVDGETVNGMIKVNEFELPFKGTYKNGVVKYKAVMERNGNTRTSTFVGKVDGDTLTGKSTSTRDGQERVRDVVAKRVK